jgi:small subunit ribosomal protein S20
LANHKSALKRAHQNEMKRLRNKSVKTKIKNITKELRLSVSESSKEEALKKV